jgi:hypothetical protein
MSERIAVIGSRSWPTPEDVTAYVHALPAGSVIVSGGAEGVDTFAATAAGRLGLPVVTHWPDKRRYGVPACYYHRTKAIIEDADRVVAFTAKDPATKQITAGTAMTIELAHRAGVPVDVVATPVPGRLCALISRLRDRYAGIKSAPTPGHLRARVQSARELFADLIVAGSEFDQRLSSGWDELAAMPEGAEKERLTDRWCGWLRTYGVIEDAIVEARGVCACPPS